MRKDYILQIVFFADRKNEYLKVGRETGKLNSFSIRPLECNLTVLKVQFCQFSTTGVEPQKIQKIKFVKESTHCIIRKLKINPI